MDNLASNSNSNIEDEQYKQRIFEQMAKSLRRHLKHYGCHVSLHVAPEHFTIYVGDDVILGIRSWNTNGTPTPNAVAILRGKTEDKVFTKWNVSEAAYRLTPMLLAIYGSKDVSEQQGEDNLFA